MAAPNVIVAVPSGEDLDSLQPLVDEVQFARPRYTGSKRMVWGVGISRLRG